MRSEEQLINEIHGLAVENRYLEYLLSCEKSNTLKLTGDLKALREEWEAFKARVSTHLIEYGNSMIKDDIPF